MGRRILIVGGGAGGASAGARIRRLDEEAEIVIFEKSAQVSVSSCSLPYFVGGLVEESCQLVMMTPSSFKSSFAIDVLVRHEVREIHPKEKYITVKDLESGTQRKEAYDVLILSPGAVAARPENIEGMDRSHVFTLRSLEDAQALKEMAQREETKKAVVVGGGFIGLEAAENLRLLGKEVCLIEGAGQILRSFDFDMVQTIQKELLDQGVDLRVKTRLTRIEDGFVLVLQDGAQKKLPADLVVLAAGSVPEISLAKGAGLFIGEHGGISVNTYFQTSDPNIYALGDVIETKNALTGGRERLELAGPAQRAARLCADHICGKKEEGRGHIGSSCLRVFSLNAASTGLTCRMAQENGIRYDFVYLLANDRVSLMPKSCYMGFKLVFEVPTGRLLGAQAIGRGDVNKRIDVLAAMITMKASLYDLKELELCYSPLYSTPKDIVNLAAMVGINVLEGVFCQVPVTDVRTLYESGAYILDVREKGEYEAGHIRGAVNLPLSELRGREKEIPKDKPVYLHCRSSQRSYYAITYLQNIGFTNVYNISGSFLGLCLYEYYADKTTGRDPIVTNYNFH